MAVMLTSVFPGVSPVNLNLRTVYNHMDAVVMRSDWDPDLPNILENDEVTFFALSYIITISKLDTVWLPNSQGWRPFSGGKFPEVSVRRADSRGYLFSSQILSELKFFADDRRCFSGRNVMKSH